MLQDRRPQCRSPAGLGAYILLYAFYSLLGEKLSCGRSATCRAGSSIRSPRSADSSPPIFGGLAGAIYVTYFDALRLSKSVFRVTMSTTLLVLSLVRSIGYVATGVFRREDVVLIARRSCR